MAQETRRQANEKLVRALFSARQDDDQGALRRLLADDVALYLPGEEPFVGRDSVFAAWDRQADLLAEALAFQADLRDLAAGDDHVYTYVETWAEAPGAGRGVNYTTMTVYRIRGGQVVEVRQHVDDVTAYGAFWSGLSPESGQSLVLALVVVLALTVSTAGLVTYLTSNEGSFSRDRDATVFGRLGGIQVELA